MNTETPALVLGGSANAVSVVRSLGAAGVRVRLSAVRGCPAARSRHLHESLPVAGKDSCQEEWRALLGPGGEPRLAGSLLLPCDDDALEFLAHERTQLAERFRLDDATSELTLALLDKRRTAELARAAGVEVPRTWEVEASKHVDAALSEVAYPVIVKPIHSHHFQRILGAGGRKFLLANDAAELGAALKRLLAHDIAALVCEKIPGPDTLLGSYYTYRDGEGRTLFHYTKKIVRRYPKNEGLACYHKTEWDDEIAALGLRFFEGIDLRGFGNVEFKRDPRDGRLKLIECNPRFTAAQELLVRSGLDTALLVYAHCTGQSVPATPRVPDGLHYWYPDRDLRAFLELRRAGELTLLQWLRGLAHRQVLPYFRWSDPWPSIGRIKDRLLGNRRR